MAPVIRFLEGSFLLVFGIPLLVLAYLVGGRLPDWWAQHRQGDSPPDERVQEISAPSSDLLMTLNGLSTLPVTDTDSQALIRDATWGISSDPGFITEETISAVAVAQQIVELVLRLHDVDTIETQQMLPRLVAAAASANSDTRLEALRGLEALRATVRDLVAAQDALETQVTSLPEHISPGHEETLDDTAAREAIQEEVERAMLRLGQETTILRDVTAEMQAKDDLEPPPPPGGRSDQEEQ